MTGPGLNDCQCLPGFTSITQDGVNCMSASSSTALSSADIAIIAGVVGGVALLFLLLLLLMLVVRNIRSKFEGAKTFHVFISYRVATDAKLAEELVCCSL